VGEFPARVTCSGSICLGFRFEMEIFADQENFLADLSVWRFREGKFLKNYQ
jgi:hypothetical protein